MGLTTFASQVVMWLPLFGMVTGLLSNRSDNVAHLSCEFFFTISHGGGMAVLSSETFQV